MPVTIVITFPFHLLIILLRSKLPHRELLTLNHSHIFFSENQTTID